MRKALMTILTKFGFNPVYKESDEPTCEDDSIEFKIGKKQYELQVGDNYLMLSSWTDDIMTQHGYWDWDMSAKTSLLRLQIKLQELSQGV